MRTHWMSRLLALLSLACVMPASAQTYALLIDGDRSTSTGCTVTSDAGSVAGIDWRGSAHRCSVAPSATHSQGWLLCSDGARHASSTASRITSGAGAFAAIS